MQKIILFTEQTSILKHWENALANTYFRVYFKDYPKLEDYLKVNKEEVILMLDELSVRDINSFLQNLESFPHATILVFNSSPQLHHASMIMGKNVRGYENSFLNKINLLNMLTSINEGKKWLFPELNNYIINRFIRETSLREPDFIVLLTDKEKEIAYLIADGLTNKEIAYNEGIAISTVKNHLKKIFAKAGVTDRVSLALKFK